MANCFIKRKLGAYKGLKESDFTYTAGKQFIQDSAKNSRVKFTSSGIFKPTRNLIVDVFLVGGGGGSNNYQRSGGGGGYTATYRRVKLKKNQSYVITIGAGGSNWGSGGKSSAFGLEASGGSAGGGNSGNTLTNGWGAGGSGGGNFGYPDSWGRNGDGGSNGGNGKQAITQQATAGKGQGTTTREFAEPIGAIYAPGGGGAGGSEPGFVRSPGYHGAGLTGANSGAGAGGGGLTGASGIVIIRNAR